MRLRVGAIATCVGLAARALPQGRREGGSLSAPRAGQAGCVRHARTVESCQRQPASASVRKPAAGRRGDTMRRGAPARVIRGFPQQNTRRKCMQAQLCYHKRRRGRKSTKRATSHAPPFVACGRCSCGARVRRLEGSFGALYLGGVCCAFRSRAHRRPCYLRAV